MACSKRQPLTAESNLTLAKWQDSINSSCRQLSTPSAGYPYTVGGGGWGIGFLERERRQSHLNA